MTSEWTTLIFPSDFFSAAWILDCRPSDFPTAGFQQHCESTEISSRYFRHHGLPPEPSIYLFGWDNLMLGTSVHECGYAWEGSDQQAHMYVCICVYMYMYIPGSKALVTFQEGHPRTLRMKQTCNPQFGSWHFTPHSTGSRWSLGNLPVLIIPSSSKACRSHWELLRCFCLKQQCQYSALVCVRSHHCTNKPLWNCCKQPDHPASRAALFFPWGETFHFKSSLKIIW